MKNNITLSAFADEAASSLDGQIKALNDNDISLIELRGVDGKNISDYAPEEAVKIAEKLAENGISVWSIGSPVGKSKLTDDFEAELKRFYNILEIAKATSAKCIRLFSFFDYAPLGDSAKGEVVRRLSHFTQAAKGSGVILCHENEKGIYGDNTERCCELLSSIPELWAVFDPANFIQCGVDTLAAWEALKERVYYLHIKDALKSGVVVPSGKGIGNLGRIVLDFAKAGGGVATLEPHLHSFCGLDRLSGDDEKSVLGNRRFENSREAFDFAVKSFRELIELID